MNEDLRALLEIAPDTPAKTPSGPPVTFLAWICQAFGWLSVIAAAVSFIPGTPSGPIGLTLPFVLSWLGLFAFGALTLLAALVAMLRVWWSSGRVRGGWHVLAGLGLLALAVNIFVARNCTF